MQTLKKLQFKLSDVSTYRSQLMGWSILWIMALHFRFISLKPFGFVAQYGFSGVEIFMFVSGLGLYHSLNKQPALLQFYQKRLIRIFPTYAIIGLFASFILLGDNLPTYLLRCTTIGFWTGMPYFEWYIPSIISLYFAAPFIKKLLDSRWSPALIVIVLFILVSAFFIAKSQPSDLSHFFLYYRIPSFIAGMVCTKCLLNKFIPLPAMMKCYWLTAALGVVVFIFCFPLHHQIYAYKYYSLFFLMPLFIAFFCIFSKLLGPLSYIIKSVGDASLEVYLIQYLFFSAIIHDQLPIKDQWHDAVTLLLIAGCSIAGILFHRAMEHVISAVSAKRNSNTGV